MRILGIDPGYALIGYGILDKEGSVLRAVDYGVIETSKNQSFPDRIEKLYRGMNYLISEYKPDAAVFEELFFCKNITTAIAVGAGRGVALLSARQAGIPLYEYTPMQIKQAVTGNGRADKHSVQSMVKLLLSLSEIPKPDDAADALACALSFANTMEPAKEEYRIK